MAVGSRSKGMLNFAGDVMQGLIKNDKAIKSEITAANKKAIKAGQRAMQTAKKNNPNLSVADLRKIKKDTMIENGFRSRQLTTGHKIGSFLGSGTRETIENMKNKDSFGKAIKKAHTKSTGGLDMKKAAGTYMTASTAGRIVTGGGLTKDKNGNTNIIGIPFI